MESAAVNTTMSTIIPTAMPPASVECMDVSGDVGCEVVGGIVALGSGVSASMAVCVGVGEGASLPPLPAHPMNAARVTTPAKASAISLGRIMESPL